MITITLYNTNFEMSIAKFEFLIKNAKYKAKTPNDKSSDAFICYQGVVILKSLMQLRGFENYNL